MWPRAASSRRTRRRVCRAWPARAGRRSARSRAGGSPDGPRRSQRDRDRRQLLCLAVQRRADRERDRARDRFLVLAVAGVPPFAVVVLVLEGGGGNGWIED